MKNKIVLYISLTLNLLVVIFLFITVSNNKSLQKTLIKKDDILKNVLIKDSLLQKSKAQYQSKISRHIQGCDFIIDGKKVDSNELMKIIEGLYISVGKNKDSLYYYRELTKRNNHFQDVIESKIPDIQKMNDSLSIYRGIYQVIKKQYGINHTGRIEGNSIIYKRPVNKVDSALAVFKYYKDKVHRDKDGTWIVDVENKR